MYPDRELTAELMPAITISAPRLTEYFVADTHPGDANGPSSFKTVEYALLTRVLRSRPPRPAHAPDLGAPSDLCRTREAMQNDSDARIGGHPFMANTLSDTA